MKTKLEELKKKATASETTLIEAVEGALLEDMVEKVLGTVGRELDPVLRDAARDMEPHHRSRFIGRVGGCLDWVREALRKELGLEGKP